MLKLSAGKKKQWDGATQPIIHGRDGHDRPRQGLDTLSTSKRIPMRPASRRSVDLPKGRNVSSPHYTLRLPKANRFYSSTQRSWTVRPASAGTVDFVLRQEGDASGDGKFGPAGLVQVLQTGKYRAGLPIVPACFGRESAPRSAARCVLLRQRAPLRHDPVDRLTATQRSCCRNGYHLFTAPRGSSGGERVGGANPRSPARSAP